MNPPPGTIGIAQGPGGPISFLVSLEEPHLLIWPYPDGDEYEWSEAFGGWFRYDEGVFCAIHFDEPEVGKYLSLRLDDSPPYSNDYST